MFKMGRDVNRLTFYKIGDQNDSIQRLQDVIHESKDPMPVGPLVGLLFQISIIYDVIQGPLIGPIFPRHFLLHSRQKSTRVENSSKSYRVGTPVFQPIPVLLNAVE